MQQNSLIIILIEVFRSQKCRSTRFMSLTGQIACFKWLVNISQKITSYIYDYTLEHKYINNV